MDGCKQARQSQLLDLPTASRAIPACAGLRLIFAFAAAQAAVALQGMPANGIMREE